MSEFTPVKVKHIPLHPPRASVAGEVIYLQLWREWAQARPLEWDAIFNTNIRARQRAASVAASFMVFMGCDCGKAFTMMAEDAATNKFFVSRERAFISAWALNNSRIRGINRNLRTSEFMLASVHPIVNNRVDWKLIPNITQDDNDVLESMAIWWSTPVAGIMRDIAEPMIQAANLKAYSQMFNPKVSKS